jgi:hypothetical protein
MTDTDKKLLELAAKAAEYGRIKYFDEVPYVARGLHGEDFFTWNPLTDDGDAMRLSVKLGLVLSPSKVSAMAWHPNAIERDSIWEPLNPDPYTATRRAIVRAAAEIGKSI